MLTSLQIKDYALIQNINVEFGTGLNIITGETGAGKSILLGALSLLLGERASSETVRKGAQKSVVEGIFYVGNNEKVKNFLNENDFEFAEELIIRREISLKGSNRCFINDTPVQLMNIKQVGDLLIDLHGQHDHQSLLNVDTHIDFLDEFCDLKTEMNSYSKIRTEFINIRGEIEELKRNEKRIKEKLELNSFQLKEINAVSPEPDEDEKLENELRIMENAEKLFDASSQIYSAVYEDENAVYDSLINIQNMIKSISQIDESILPAREEINSAVELLKDIGDFMRDYKEKIEIDPEALDSMRERSGAIHLLKKKYGGTLENVLNYKSKIEVELSLAENFSFKIEELEKQSEKLRSELKKQAIELSSLRKSKAPLIQKEIEKSLSFLGINDSSFEIKFEHEESVNSPYYVEIDKKKISFFSNGIDNVEFYISTNKGEDPKPLTKTASGGEISRVMLAIKSVMAKTEKLPLLVFDEIDTGISGRIAQKVGKVLKDLSTSHQIIAITHLPQIAAFSNHHFAVSKEVCSDRSVSLIRKLDEEERVQEIAKLLGGEKITDSNILTAKEIVATSR
jgi:DNA repair protein RecN (Recombination protein N)